MVDLEAAELGIDPTKAITRPMGILPLVDTRPMGLELSRSDYIGKAEDFIKGLTDKDWVVLEKIHHIDKPYWLTDEKGYYVGNVVEVAEEALKVLIRSVAENTAEFEKWHTEFKYRIAAGFYGKILAPLAKRFEKIRDTLMINGSDSFWFLQFSDDALRKRKGREKNREAGLTGPFGTYSYEQATNGEVDANPVDIGRTAKKAAGIFFNEYDANTVAIGQSCAKGNYNLSKRFKTPELWAKTLLNAEASEDMGCYYDARKHCFMDRGEKGGQTLRLLRQKDKTVEYLDIDRTAFFDLSDEEAGLLLCSRTAEDVDGVYRAMQEYSRIEQIRLGDQERRLQSEVKAMRDDLEGTYLVKYGSVSAKLDAMKRISQEAKEIGMQTNMVSRRGQELFGIIQSREKARERGRNDDIIGEFKWKSLEDLAVEELSLGAEPVPPPFSIMVDLIGEGKKYDDIRGVMVSDRKLIMAGGGRCCATLVLGCTGPDHDRFIDRIEMVCSHLQWDAVDSVEVFKKILMAMGEGGERTIESVPVKARCVKEGRGLRYWTELGVLPEMAAEGTKLREKLERQMGSRLCQSSELLGFVQASTAVMISDPNHIEIMAKGRNALNKHLDLTVRTSIKDFCKARGKRDQRVIDEVVNILCPHDFSTRNQVVAAMLNTGESCVACVRPDEKFQRLQVATPAHFGRLVFEGLKDAFFKYLDKDSWDELREYLFALKEEDYASYLLDSVNHFGMDVVAAKHGDGAIPVVASLSGEDLRNIMIPMGEKLAAKVAQLITGGGQVSTLGLLDMKSQGGESKLSTFFTTAFSENYDFVGAVANENYVWRERARPGLVLESFLEMIRNPRPACFKEYGQTCDPLRAIFLFTKYNLAAGDTLRTEMSDFLILLNDYYNTMQEDIILNPEKIEQHYLGVRSVLMGEKETSLIKRRQIIERNGALLVELLMKAREGYPDLGNFFQKNMQPHAIRAIEERGTRWVLLNILLNAFPGIIFRTKLIKEGLGDYAIDESSILHFLSALGERR